MVTNNKKDIKESTDSNNATIEDEEVKFDRICKFFILYLFHLLLKEIKKLHSEFPQTIKEVRGKGLFCAMVIRDRKGKNAWDVCLQLMKNGLLAKPTHGDIIRFAPPLIITEEQLNECIGIIRRVIAAL